VTRPLGVDALDDKVRSRLAEIRAAAGVPHSQISLEVLYFLPKAFVEKYGELFTKAVKSDGGEDARARQQTDGAEVAKVAVRKTGAGPTIGAGGKRYKKTFVVLDEKALDLKSRMDKRLRGMAREIETELAGGEALVNGASICGKCGMFMQLTWLFCPKDGMPRGNE
jgi:hypothetical protein